jgi:hypothetical protein
MRDLASDERLDEIFGHLFLLPLKLVPLPEGFLDLFDEHLLSFTGPIAHRNKRVLPPKRLIHISTHEMEN